MRFLFLSLPFLFALFLQNVSAYVPATPTNSSAEVIAAGLNITENSKLNMKWFGQGCVRNHSVRFLSHIVCSAYTQNISYLLAGTYSNGISKVH